MATLKKNSAFTLLEILLVIAIIAILAMAGAGSYSIARRGIAVDLETDKIIALLQDLREQTKISATCIKVQFLKNQQKITKETAQYENRRCGNFSSSDIPLNSNIVTADITANETARDNLAVLFTPPFGALSSEPTAQTAEIKLAFKTNQTAWKKISINLISGKIEKSR